MCYPQPTDLSLILPQDTLTDILHSIPLSKSQGIFMSNTILQAALLNNSSRKPITVREINEAKKQTQKDLVTLKDQLIYSEAYNYLLTRIPSDKIYKVSFKTNVEIPQRYIETILYDEYIDPSDKNGGVYGNYWEEFDLDKIVEEILLEKKKELFEALNDDNYMILVDVLVDKVEIVEPRYKPKGIIIPKGGQAEKAATDLKFPTIYDCLNVNLIGIDYDGVLNKLTIDSGQFITLDSETGEFEDYDPQLDNVDYGGIQMRRIQRTPGSFSNTFIFENEFQDQMATRNVYGVDLPFIVDVKIVQPIIGSIE